MGRVRITRPIVLLALAALMAPQIEASRTSVWESNPPASFSVARTEAVSALAPLALAATADAEPTEPPLFNLGDVVLVEHELAREDRFDLGPLTLVDLNLLRGPPPSYPETRVGGFELLVPFRVGASPRLSLWSRQACGFSCLGLVSDSPEDPWGLQAAPDLPMDEVLRRASAKAAGKTARDIEEVDGFWGRVGRRWDQFWDTASDWWGGTVNDTASTVNRPLEAADAVNREVARKAGDTVGVLTEAAFPLPHGEAPGAQQARAVGLGNENVAGAGGGVLASGLRRTSGEVSGKVAEGATYAALGAVEAEGVGKLAGVAESVEVKSMRVGPSGHHVPAVRKALGRPFEVGRSDKTRPTMFSRSSNPGVDHYRLHKSERPYVGSRRGSFPGSDNELFDAYRKAYQGLDDIRVDVRSPNGTHLLATDVSPRQAVDVIEGWLKEQGLR